MTVMLITKASTATGSWVAHVPSL